MNQGELIFEWIDIFFRKDAKIVFMFDFSDKRHIHFIIFHRGYNPRNSFVNFLRKAFIPYAMTQTI